jgi:hypothetical protein
MHAVGRSARRLRVAPAAVAAWRSRSSRRSIGAPAADEGEVSTASTSYDVALAFTRSEGGDIVACEPKEARSCSQATRTADALATTDGHCGAVAFSRTGDPALGDFEDAVILKTVGEVDSGLLAG